MPGKSSDDSAGKGHGRSLKAGITFPVGRIHRYLKRGRYADRVGGGAAIYMASVLEYLVAEVLELAGNAANDNKRSRVSPRHIQLAVRNDEELHRLLGKVTIAEGGVLPHVHKELMQKKGKSKSKKKGSQTTATTTTDNGVEESGPGKSSSLSYKLK
ncbi:histone H2A [Kwoniella mangroviensis CBS 10435]|uniref:Histone H2A n=1 Tax=Kwoniella mangroviensis CBS 10435 TaxID=1331196 RepID=A0A1B9IHC8_9TREE|nr:histone H2A [Kwoniella mangroviensis CBS 8507]OCF55099.1 histone H2A [Kwoniella mangroviensis CBS 10435]OCF62769.1 histone H2A [Kwoniella mangroviensis CBS 8507]OCF72179.1 histone H2A [Kwoniella mangroviensis CBS 8886]